MGGRSSGLGGAEPLRPTPPALAPGLLAPHPIQVWLEPRASVVYKKVQPMRVNQAIPLSVSMNVQG